MIIFEKLPMPPSVNQAYRVVRFGKRAGLAKSTEYKEYCIAMRNYALAHRHKVLDAIGFLKERHFLKFDATFYFPKHRILTLKGLPKRMDTTNFVKVMHDQVCLMTEIDDCRIVVSVERKAISSDDSSHVSIIITPMEHMTGDDIEQNTLPKA